MIVTSDIGGADPDDVQSLVHLMVMLNDVDLEGIISQHAWVPYGTGADTLIEKVIKAYNQVLPNLRVHDKRYPDADYLRSIVKIGQPEAAMACVGKGKDTEGSEWIIKVVDRDDERPVWIAAWSGMNTLAQALWKVSHTRSEAEIERFVGKIRVYDILGQDDAGAWIAKTFPKLTYIRNKKVYGWPKDDAWYKANIQNVGPLGAVYPDRIWATEGDSPSFLYCINNGLNSPENIDWGGWGGRFSKTKKADIESMSWVKRSNLNEMQYSPYLMHGAAEEGDSAIAIWAEDIHDDFKARMQWSITSDYAAANHHPIVKIKGHNTTDIIRLEAESNDILELDASSSFDPDGDSLSYQWIYYQEPSSFKGKVIIEGAESPHPILHIPEDSNGHVLHYILRLRDNAPSPLCSYQRIVVNVSSNDYIWSLENY